ncbi:hypothetical protein E4U55_000997 [Claviceps digitariae]|nr:hypothetical protein E4U55_000997 [Claviceps digitariae]
MRKSVSLLSLVAALLLLQPLFAGARGKVTLHGAQFHLVTGLGSRPVHFDDVDIIRLYARLSEDSTAEGRLSVLTRIRDGAGARIAVVGGAGHHSKDVVIRLKSIHHTLQDNDDNAFAATEYVLQASVGERTPPQLRPANHSGAARSVPPPTTAASHSPSSRG